MSPNTMIDPQMLCERARRLSVDVDGDENVIGRPDLGIYVAVPEPGAVFIQALRDGAPLAYAVDRASAAAGQEVDGVDFLASLAEAGLLDEPSEAGDRTGVNWIEGVSQRAAAPLFGKVAWAFYLACGLFAGYVFASHADLRPNFENAWFLPDPMVSMLVLFPIGLVVACGHEAWHWLAGRALGVPASFRASFRGLYLVFETDVTQVVTKPRSQRYSVFLAGMAFDTVVLAAALALRLAYRQGVIELAPVLDRLLGAVVLVQSLALAWQIFAVFMRSDVYAVLANLLRCHNLYRATWLTTKQRLLRLNSAEEAELAEMGQHDRLVARWFGVVYLAGVGAMIWMFLNFGAPFLISMIVWVGQGVADGAMTSVVFWESVAVLGLIVVQYGLLPILARRERRLRAKGVLL